jgi:hypothetical protein
MSAPFNPGFNQASGNSPPPLEAQYTPQDVARDWQYTEAYIRRLAKPHVGVPGSGVTARQGPKGRLSIRMTAGGVRRVMAGICVH